MITVLATALIFVLLIFTSIGVFLFRRFRASTRPKEEKKDDKKDDKKKPPTPMHKWAINVVDAMTLSAALIPPLVVYILFLVVKKLITS